MLVMEMQSVNLSKGGQHLFPQRKRVQTWRIIKGEHASSFTITLLEISSRSCPRVWVMSTYRGYMMAISPAIINKMKESVVTRGDLLKEPLIVEWHMLGLFQISFLMASQNPTCTRNVVHIYPQTTLNLLRWKQSFAVSLKFKRLWLFNVPKFLLSFG